MIRHFDGPSLAVIVATFVLFVAAVFTTGLTHDLLLEAGVFLVSVKLILAAYKSKVAGDEVRERLDRIEALLRDLRERER